MSGPGIQPQSPPKLAPQSLGLHAAPRRVLRFKPSALIGIATVASIAAGAAIWFALEHSPSKPAPQQQFNVRPQAKPESIASMPSTYDKVKLGPPLPGDLGRGVVARENSLGVSPTSNPYTPNAADEAAKAEQMRLAQQARQAAESGVLVQIADGSSAPSAPAVLPNSPPATTPGNAGQLNLDLANDQNAQGRKLNFAQQKDQGGIYNPHALQEPASPYEVMAGSVISASLLTGLNSDLPGEVDGWVTQNVYDSVTGQILLIPQGSRLKGHYDSVIAFGQSRAFVVWQRIIMPDGSSVEIDNLAATDPAGYTGLEDDVDYHTWTLLKGIAMSTLLGVGAQVTFGSNNSDLVEAIRESAAESTNQAGQRIVEKDLNIQPTITVRPGWPLRVLVSKDIILKPYRG